MNEIVTVVAVTFNHGRILRGFCDNMLNQHGVEGKWKCIILHDGSIKSADSAAIESSYQSSDIISNIRVSERFGVSRKVGIKEPIVLDYPTAFTYVETTERANCYGHNLRAMGLDMVDTPWVHITNADNQYCYGWLERVIPVIEREDPDLIYWNCSHSYKEFDLFEPKLHGGGIDFCNYMMKTSLAKEIGFPWRHFEADGAQIETFVKTFPEARIRKMTGVFSIHN